MSKKSPESDPIDQRLVTSLAHPLRVQILEILNEQEASPKSLAEQFEIPIGVTAYHVKVLCECESITLTHTEPRRGAQEHFYRASPRSFIGHQDWRRVPRSLRGDVTVAALRTFIRRVIAALKEGKIDSRGDTPFAWFTISVDKVGWSEVVEIMRGTLSKLHKVHEQSTARAEVSGERLTPVVVGLAAFEAARSGEKS